MLSVPSQIYIYSIFFVQDAQERCIRLESSLIVNIVKDVFCYTVYHSFHQRTCILIVHLDDCINITVLLVYMYCLENQCFGVYCVN